MTNQAKSIMDTYEGGQLMTTKTWQVMNSLEEAFSEITALGFMLEQLQEAVNANDTQQIVDITAALNAFYPVYTNNWDKKFKKAWNEVVVK